MDIPSAWEAFPPAEDPLPSLWAYGALVSVLLPSACEPIPSEVVEVLLPSVCEYNPLATVPKPSACEYEPEATEKEPSLWLPVDSLYVNVLQPSACELWPDAIGPDIMLSPPSAWDHFPIEMALPSACE